MKPQDVYRKGVTEKVNGNYENAVRLFREAASSPALEPMLSYNVNNMLAALLLELGRYLEALQPAQLALQIELEHFDREHRKTALADCYAILSRVMEGLGRYSDAADYMKNAVESLLRFYEDDYQLVRILKADYLRLLGETWRG